MLGFQESFSLGAILAGVMLGCLGNQSDRYPTAKELLAAVQSSLSTPNSLPSKPSASGWNTIFGKFFQG